MICLYFDWLTDKFMLYCLTLPITLDTTSNYSAIRLRIPNKKNPPVPFAEQEGLFVG